MDAPERLIKKYPNRRLYDTCTSTYITLADIKQLVLNQETFQVVDAKSGEDLTRSILLQIILEEESCDAPMFSTDMLSQMIRFYGSTMQGMMGRYLDSNMKAFVEMQNKFKEQAGSLYGGTSLGNPELWGQFLNFQAPAMQNMMRTYIEQSQQMFQNMQENLAEQTRKIFPGGAMPPKNEKPQK
jgi:polyhydroxyalkanoate synthesis repressor PhaR